MLQQIAKLYRDLLEQNIELHHENAKLKNLNLEYAKQNEALRQVNKNLTHKIYLLQTEEPEEPVKDVEASIKDLYEHIEMLGHGMQLILEQVDRQEDAMKGRSVTNESIR